MNGQTVTASGALPLVVLLVGGSLTACVSHPFVRPSGPSAPAPDATTVWTEAMASCQSLNTYAATLGLTGRIGDQRIRGMASATLGVAVTAAGQVGLEARVSGQLLFKLGGSAERATLFLGNENRTVTARAEELVYALIGIRLGPEQLWAILSGCPSPGGPVESGDRYGELVRFRTPEAVVFVDRREGAWRPRAVELHDLLVDYQVVERGLPMRLTLTSLPERAPAVSLSLRVKSVDTNIDLPPSAFMVVVPEGATPMTIEELRASSPLSERGGSR